MEDFEKKEIIKLIEECDFSKGQKKQILEYIQSKKYPKEKTPQIAFYRIYKKIRRITRLGNKLIKLKLMKT